MATIELRRAGRGRSVEIAGRLGLVAKGVLYLIIGAIAVKVPLGLGGRPADRQGALQIVAEQPLGKGLLLALAAGLGGYAIWRLAQAALDRDGDGNGAKGLARRAGHLGKGILYAGSGVLALAIATGRHAGGSDERQETAEMLGLPAGRWLVAAIGLAFLGAGLFNAYRSLTARFRDHLREHEVGPASRPWVLAVGVAGHAARGVVFLLIGGFLLKAAVEFDPQEAVGLDGALRRLAEQPHGRFLLGAVAAGLVAYGLYCFVQARYRKV